MWFVVGTIVGFFVGLSFFVLFSSHSTSRRHKLLVEENEALSRKLYLMEHIHRGRHARRIKRSKEKLD